MTDLDHELIKRNASIRKIINRSASFVINEGYSEDKLHIAKGYGCYVEDYSGRVYTDTTFGAGTHILGYGHKILAREAARQFKEGSLFTVPTKYTYEVAGHLSGILPQFDRFVFCNSGSEATMRAARVARALTGRKKIAVFSGGWHGGNDLFLFEDDWGKGEKKPRPVLKSAGSPQELLKTILMLPYNCEEAFELITKHKNELAMVMIEPSQGSNPRDDMGPFLKKLRAITKQYGIVLCFDEMITGFRIALGGCQQHYGIEADMATYGKTLGGGMPIGMIAGKKEVMDIIAGKETGKPVFMGGTFSANPLAMRTSRTLLEILTKHKKTLYPYLNDQGSRMRKEVNDFCVARQIPVHMIGIGSMSRLIFTDKPVKSRRDRDRLEAGQGLQNRFYLHLLLKEGIHVSTNRIIFVSWAHRKKDIAKIIKSICNSLEYFSSDLKKKS